MRVRAGFAALAVFSLVLAGCAGSETEGSGGTGTSAPTSGSGQGAAQEEVRVAIAQEVASADPHGANGQSFWSLLVNFGNVAEGLVTFDGQSSELQPVLAESWEYVDDTTLEMKLRSGVQFSDGTELTADIVKQNFERVLNPDVQSAVIDFFSSVEQVEAVDDVTLQLTTSAPDPTLLRKIWGLQILAPANLEGVEDLGSELIGTGPYKVASSSPDGIVLEANENYWGGAPAVKTVHLQAMPEAASRIAALQAGEVDIMFDVPPSQVGSVPATVVEPALEVVNWRMNALGGLTQDPNVRRALALAVDEEEIRLALFGDEYSEPYPGQPVFDGVFGYNPDITEKPNDPDEARRLLEEAGVIGETVEIVNTGRYPQSIEFGEAMAEQIRAVGMEVNLDNRDTQGWLDVLYAQEGSEVEMVLNGAGSEIWDAGVSLQKTAAAGSPISEFPHDDFPGFQESLDEAQREIDETAREELLHEALQNWHDADAYLGGYIFSSIWGKQDNISWHSRRDNRIDFNTITFQ